MPFRPKKEPQTPVVYPSTSRIEAFSDGVIAIIITIMVLEIKVPQLVNGFSTQEFWVALQKLLPKILSYGMSFVIVGIFWVNHHNFFHNIKRSDGKLLWYNNNLLFWLSLVPVPTALLGEHPHDKWAVISFGFIMTMAGLAFPLMGYYAMFRSSLMDEKVGLEARKKAISRSAVGCVMYFLSMVLAPISIYISWGIFFLVPIYYFLPRDFQLESMFD
jgi:uncharacterized membrane protein